MDEQKKCMNCENPECQGCGGSVEEKKEEGEGKTCGTNCEAKPETPATPEQTS